MIECAGEPATMSTSVASTPMRTRSVPGAKNSGCTSARASARSPSVQSVIPSPLTKPGVTTSVMWFRSCGRNRIVPNRIVAGDQLAVRQLEQARGRGEGHGEAGGAFVHGLEVVVREAGSREGQRTERLDQRGGVDARRD